MTAAGAAPDELLDAWAALAAHQLGEAMSLVSGYASLLREQYAGTLGPGVDDALQGMLNGTERLRRYVDDLLDLQHARDPAEGTADLDAALAGAVEELRVFIERAKARVESGALGQAAVAPAKAERLFSHVVRGALAAGARLRARSPVESIEPARSRGYRLRTTTGTIRAGRVVDAAGAWAAPVARMVGVKLTVAGSILQVSVTEPRSAILPQLIQHIGRRLTLKQTPHGSFVIGGGWAGGLDPPSQRATPRVDSIVGNAWVAVRTLPALQRLRLVRSWAGVGANTPDWGPILGECRGARGFYMLFAGVGFTLGPLCARLLAEQIATGSTSLSIAPHSPERFAS